MMSAAVMIGIAGNVETAQKMSSGAEQSLMPSFAQSLGESVDLSDGKPPQSEEGNEKRMAGSFSASGVAFSIGSSKVVVRQEESGKQLEGQKILSSGEAKVVPSREIERDGKPEDFLKEKPGIVTGDFGKVQGVSANGIESEKDDQPVKMETEKVAGEEVSGEEHVLADPSGEEMEATSSSESGPPVVQKTAWSNPALEVGAPRHEEVPATSLYDGRPSVLKLGKPVEAKSEESASLKEVGSKEKKAGAKTVSSSGKSGKREGALKTASSASEAQGVVSILPQMLAPVSAIVAAPEKDDSGVGVAHESGISIGTVVAEDVRGRQDAALVSPPVGKGEADIAGGKVPLKGDQPAVDFNSSIAGVGWSERRVVAGRRVSSLGRDCGAGWDCAAFAASGGADSQAVRQCGVYRGMDKAVAQSAAADLRRAVGMQRPLCSPDGSGCGATRTGRWCGGVRGGSASASHSAGVGDAGPGMDYSSSIAESVGGATRERYRADWRLAAAGVRAECGTDYARSRHTVGMPGSDDGGAFAGDNGAGDAEDFCGEVRPGPASYGCEPHSLPGIRAEAGCGGGVCAGKNDRSEGGKWVDRKCAIRERS